MKTKYRIKRRPFLLAFSMMCFYVYLHFLNMGLIDYFTSSLLIFGDEDGNKKGFGLQERERKMERIQEREHRDDDDSFAINNISEVVIVGTILVIIGVSIYASYKIYVIKKKSSKSKTS